MSETVLAVFLAFFLLHWAIETGLTGLNLLHGLSAPPKAPGLLSEFVDEQSVLQSRAYTTAKLRMDLVEGAAGMLFTLTVLLSGILPWLSAMLPQWFGWADGSSHQFVVFLMAVGFAFGLFGLPFSLFSTFVIEARYGFNRTTPMLWIIDKFRGLALSLVLGVPFLYGVYGFMAHTGEAWWIWLFGFITVFQVVLVWIYPIWIAPLFNKFTPLPDGEFRQRLEELAQRGGFRPRGISVMDASKRSGHSNAYFTGFFRPRIVLFDTLLENMSVEEALAVLAHEMGHFAKRHIHKGLVMSMLGLLVMLYVLSVLVDWQPLFQAFGFPQPSLHAALVLAMLCGSAFTFPLGPLMAWRSRAKEYEADAYSVDLAGLPEAMKTALVRLSRENLSNLNPHPWYSAWHYSHPTLPDRLAAIDQLKAERNLGKPS